MLHWMVFLTLLLVTFDHGDPTDMHESTSGFKIRTINWSKLDKLQESVNRLV